MLLKPTFKYFSIIGLVVGGLFLTGASRQFSNLSDGLFETQLQLQAHPNLEASSKEMKSALEAYNKLPFDIGERFRFVVTYMGARGGAVELLLRTPVKWNKTWAHRVTGEAKSAEWFKWVFEMHDSVEGIFDHSPEMLPYHFYINQLEGGFKQTKLIKFDAKQKKIFQTTNRPSWKKPKEDEFEYVKNAKDALGAFYYVRTLIALEDLTKTKTFEFPIFTSEKTWKGSGRFVRSETKKVEGIDYETDVLELKTQFGSLMEQKGDLRVWLTRDSRRLPVYIEADIKVGSVKLSLSEWDQGWADPKKKKIYPKIRGKL